MSFLSKQWQNWKVARAATAVRRKSHSSESNFFETDSFLSLQKEAAAASGKLFFFVKAGKPIVVASVLPAKFCIESCKTFELPQLFLVFVFVLRFSGFSHASKHEAPCSCGGGSRT